MAARIDTLLDAVRRGWPGYVERPGQRAMMDAVARTLLAARVKDAPPPADEERGRNLLLVEGRTGTGKTLGYLIPLVAIATAKELSAVVATATVGLQEQLVLRDLPRLAALSPWPFAFSIMKGRGRYLCRAKLDALTGDVAQDSLFGDEAPDPDAAVWERPPQAHEIRWLRQVARQVDEGAWNGDRDALDPPPDAGLWGRVAADRNGCAGANCHAWRTCSFFAARREARAARIVVANHDLVLSTLAHEAPTLGAPEEMLFVFDEAHHLPDIGIAQFTSRVALESALRALDRLPAALRRAANALGEAPLAADAAALAQATATVYRDLQRAFAMHPEILRRGRLRFPQGTLPEEMAEMCVAARVPLETLLDRTKALHAAVSRRLEDADDAAKAGLGLLLSDLGAQQARIQGQIDLWLAWERHDAVPLAKWVEREDGHAPGRSELVLAASPITAAGNLSRHLWRRVGAAVCTSATLAACGDFDFYARLAGLRKFPAHGRLAVESPFDYPRQGLLVVPRMKTDPRDAEAHTAELAALLPERLRDFDRGQLVLFASRKQMEQVAALMPAGLRDEILVQGEASRSELLRRHGERVEAGTRSVLFGLQGFGEGLDLPGALCEHVAIAKIPFAPPDGPVEEALAEWLTGLSRDPFAEVTVPRAGLKLVQWVGRAIRTADDRAEITLFDRRLVSKSYGARLRRGLPAFSFADLGAR